MDTLICHVVCTSEYCCLLLVIISHHGPAIDHELTISNHCLPFLYQDSRNHQLTLLTAFEAATTVWHENKRHDEAPSIPN